MLIFIVFLALGGRRARKERTVLAGGVKGLKEVRTAVMKRVIILENDEVSKKN